MMSTVSSLAVTSLTVEPSTLGPGQTDITVSATISYNYNRPIIFIQLIYYCTIDILFQIVFGKDISIIKITAQIIHHIKVFACSTAGQTLFISIVKITVMQSSIAVGISLPVNIIKKIDTERGDVSRSRYVLRLIEKMYIVNNQNHEGVRSDRGKNNKNSLDSRFGSLQPSESLIP